jgi:DNA-3-methyladenine glycosylase I
MTQLVRCPWAGDDPLYRRYHDEEWGVPSHDDQHLFEMLILEGAQAGLSWITILRKRDAYRLAYRGFDPAAVARFTSRDRARLLQNEGIVRNRAKIDASVANARAFLQIAREHRSFDAFLWERVGGRPIQNRFRSTAEVPAKTALAEALSKDLRKRGFSFVGPTILYAFFQAVGLVNDHLVGCFRHRPLGGRGR